MTDPSTGNTSRLGFDGFATREFDGPHPSVCYIDAEHGLLEEVRTVGDGGALHGQRIRQHIHDDDLIVHSASLNYAIA